MESANMNFKNISHVVDLINNKLNSIKVPPGTLPAELLRCVADNREGLSAYRTTARIIANNKLLGIPTDPNPDGSENYINKYTYNIVKCVFDAIKYEAVVKVVVPSNSLLISADGANAGGEVHCIGTNNIDSKASGIVQ